MDRTSDSGSSNPFKQQLFERFERAGLDAVLLDLQRGAFVPGSAEGGLAATWVGDQLKKRADDEAARAGKGLDLTHRATEAAERAAAAAEKSAQSSQESTKWARGAAIASAVAAIASAIAAAWPYLATIWNLPGAPK